MGARINSLVVNSFVVIAAAFPTVFTTPFIAANTFAPAEEPAQMVDHVENAAYQFVGQITADNVHVRSGPGDNHYATLRLDRGAEVTVLGMKFDWLKILPPEGSYSAIARQFVQRYAGTANTGVVTATNVRVRAAGNASNLKTMVQCQLNVGDVVTILGEEDGYYQIKPPAEAYVFVNQKSVQPVRQINVAAARQERREDASAGTFAPPGIDTIAGPTTQPVNGSDAVAQQKPTTQPVRWDIAKMQTEFDRLEDRVKAIATQRLDEQPIKELIAGYEVLSQQRNLPVTMRQFTNVRLLTLRAKLKSQEEYLSMVRAQDETDKKLAALRAQREAVEQRMIGNIVVYTAVGTLQASTLQAGSGTLYRLTDPATGRTLCYVRRGTNDSKFGAYVERFVGVKGELTSDPQLSMKVIPATEIVAVDPEQVNKTIVAQLVPPSLLSRTVSGKQ